ncbi:hypothetical protein BC829DRAFT_267785 [Chytridium lagenaria]|nr:hypothetical protein BC829DRAFT_267785 [Chytridium lagenaria]
MIRNMFLSKKAQRGADGKLAVHAIPAPWDLTVGKSFVLPFNVGPHNAEVLRKHLVTEYDKDDFLGTGPSFLMLVRYTDSPAGAYDELLLINGASKIPRQGPSRCQRPSFRANSSTIVASHTSGYPLKPLSGTAAQTGGFVKSSLISIGLIPIKEPG